MLMTSFKYFTKQITKKNLIDVYNEHIKSNPVVGLDRINNYVFSKRLNDEIDTIRRKINNQTYRFSTYKQKLISKGASKLPRVISIPTVRDRLVLKMLCQHLQYVYQAQIKQEIPQIKIDRIKSVIEKGECVQYIKIDLECFYPSIDHEILLDKIKKRIKSKKILGLLKKAIKTPTHTKHACNEINESGVPQGIAISNILADIFFIDIDDKLKSLAGCYYERYVDDILILSSNNNGEMLYHEVVGILQNNKLKVHDKDQPNSKSVVSDIDEKFSFLGYQFDSNVITVKKENRHKLETSIIKLFTASKYQLDKADITPEMILRYKNILQWRVNLRLTGCVFEGARRGWVFYYSQINDMTLLHSIDHFVIEISRRFGLSDIKFKKISKAFIEAKSVRKDEHKYILNFDNLSVDKKRNILCVYLGEERLSYRKVSDDDINRLFKMRIKHIIIELEKDIQPTS